MKKTTVMIIALFIMLTLCSCKKDKAPTDDPTANTVPSVMATEAPTQTPTEAPTEAPTEEPTNAPTEAPTENVFTPLDILGVFKGTWTSSDGRFICFSEEDGEAYAFFAIWNSGGDFPAGKIIDASANPGGYAFTVSYSNADYAGQTERFTIAPITETTFDINSLDASEPYWDGRFEYYPQHQFPNPDEFFMPSEG